MIKVIEIGLHNQTVCLHYKINTNTTTYNPLQMKKGHEERHTVISSETESVLKFYPPLNVVCDSSSVASATKNIFYVLIIKSRWKGTTYIFFF